jgi:hypothetical protein
MQRRALREYVCRRGWTVATEVKEVGSGASVRELRQKLLDAARRRDIDVVVFWRLDRWRRSMTYLVTTLQELRDLDVGFVSLTEALDLSTPSGRAMAGLLAVFAEFDARSYVSASVPVWLTPGRTASVWAGRRQPRSMRNVTRPSVVHSRFSERSKKNLIPHNAIVTVGRETFLSLVR